MHAESEREPASSHKKVVKSHSSRNVSTVTI
jgi:hypothetical protein